MFDTVIVGVDGPQAARDALELATRLASPDAQVTLAYVDVVPRRPGPRSGAVTEAARALRALQRLASLREASTVDGRTVCVQASSVAAGLHALAVRRKGDLLVIGASRRDEYERSFAGDDARAVLKDAPCPVAVAPIGYAARPPALKRIGVAYDGSPESEPALALARRLTRERGAELSAFEAVPQPAYVQSLVDPQPEIEAGLTQARQRIADLGDVEAHAAAGDDAAEALARYGASVDLLVLGAHRSRWSDHLLPGSTAQRLADTAPCPVLVLAGDHRQGRRPAHEITPRHAAANLVAKDAPAAAEMMLWAAVYRGVDAALDEFATFEHPHDTETIGRYDAAVVENEDGQSRIVKRVDRPRVRVIPETLYLPGGDLEAVAGPLRPGEAALVVVAELS